MPTTIVNRFEILFPGIREFVKEAGYKCSFGLMEEALKLRVNVYKRDGSDGVEFEISLSMIENRQFNAINDLVHRAVKSLKDKEVFIPVEELRMALGGEEVKWKTRYVNAGTFSDWRFHYGT